ncbi:reverse transcriptase family protein [Thalassoglobus sp.]|uniref:reverse transcriptase family protein n=1 Tax=Thalassoglobus sp. TaxID=2795869 RepID=UPI003AA8D84A
MGLFDFIKGLFGGSAQVQSEPIHADVNAGRAQTERNQADAGEAVHHEHSSPENSSSTRVYRERKESKNIVLRKLGYRPSTVATPQEQEIVSHRPYKFAVPGPHPGEFLDLSQDADERWLEYYGLPTLATPDDLADWFGISIGKLAWLTHRMRDGNRPKDVKDAHYHFQWKKKRSGSWRLIEAPKEELKGVQTKILREILDLVPAHPAAHGFVPGRSILSNAVPHVGSKFLLKLDLENFYPTVRYSRVVAIFRSLGFSREVSIWLARLTVSAPPWSLDAPMKNWEFWQLMPPHLPQGAPTSPALANLSAFALDVRLSGMAKAYNLKYTRYADDLTFSGPGLSIPALNEFIPLTSKIITSERFLVNKKKRKIIRNSQRQCVTGVVVNEKINVSRQDYDQLKAILHNCVKTGPQQQNRNQHPDFASHLRGRIAHMMQLNPSRGAKLLEIYQKIRW